MFAIMNADKNLSIKIVRLLEGVRIAEGMSFPDFVTHFDISQMSYYRWRQSVKNGDPMDIPMSTIQRGLESLGYDAYVIITKSDRK